MISKEQKEQKPALIQQKQPLQLPQQRMTLRFHKPDIPNGIM